MKFTSNSWDVKEVNRFGVTHIEIRKNFGGAQMLILVALDGYNFKRFEMVDPQEAGLRAHIREQNWKRKNSDNRFVQYDPNARNMYAGSHLDHYSTKGYQVRMSLNGPAQMTMADFDDIHDQVHKAFERLVP